MKEIDIKGFSSGLDTSNSGHYETKQRTQVMNILNIPRTNDEWLNDFRGRNKITIEEFEQVLAFAITANRYATQRWYKKIRKFR